MLINFCQCHNLKIINTYYKSRRGKRWTWVAPNEVYKNEIDFAQTNDIKIVTDFQVLNNLNFYTNHRLIRTTIKIKAIKKKRNIKEKIIDYDLAEDEISNYKTMLQQDLQICHGENIQSNYNNIEGAIKKAELSLTAKTKSKKRSKLSNETKTIIKHREHLRKIKHKTIKQKIELAELRKLSKRKIRQDLQKFENDIIEEILDQCGSTKRIDKELTSGKKVASPTKKEKWRPRIQFAQYSADCK